MRASRSPAWRLVSVVLPPLAVLLVGLLATLSVWRTVAAHDRVRAEHALARQSSEAALAVAAELRRYRDLARVVAGLDPASELLTYGEFTRFVDSLDLARSYPGVSGASLVVPVDDAGLPGLTARVTADADRPAEAGGGTAGADQHFVQTAARRADGTPPLLAADLADVAEPAEALRQARDRGEPALSRTHVLLRDRDLPPDQQQLSFVMAAPVYAGDGVPSTVAGRRAALRAWALVSFRGGDFLGEILRVDGRDLDVELRDGDRTVAVAHDGTQPGWWREERLEVGDRSWSLRTAPRPAFLAGSTSTVPELTLVGGVLTSVLLAALVAALAGGRRRALLAVDRTTASLGQAKADLERSNAEARALAAFQRDFAASASHELRTPLTAVMGYLELVLDFGDELTQDTRDHLETVRRASRRLQSLVDDLLTVNQVESGRLPLAPSPVRVDELLGSVRELFGQVCAAGGLRLVVSGAERLPPLLVDRSRIDQVLANLVGNAIKFTPRGGEVRVRAWRAGETVNLAVSDTGPGIPPDELPHVFDRFFRSASAHARGVPGTGLGLHIARSMVQAHGGTLGVRSRVGEGTTFVVGLPAVERSEEESWLVSSSSTTTSPS